MLFKFDQNPKHLYHQEAKDLLVHYYIRMSNQALKSKVKLLYRTLLHLGKDYPKGPEYFRSRLHAAFMKNKDLKDPKQIELMLAKGNYIVKELEALYMLRKYRTLKKRYYNVES
ncbi:unnamed protein product [Lymnaea stagnalis]|uniref:Complex 1 LYR protein domain-containing protein n=1 Tax=Lymnaea stagnalis TaxID=6523 RepID=A0AAV2HNH3_LYMST